MDILAGTGVGSVDGKIKFPVMLSAINNPCVFETESDYSSYDLTEEEENSSQSE